MAVPHFELARDPAHRADGQLLLDPVEIVEEEHQFDVAGLVLDQHPERSLAAGGRAGGARSTRTCSVAMASTLASRIFGRARRSSAPTGRWNSRSSARASRAAEQAVESPRVLRPDAGQGAHGREQGIEQRGTHERSTITTGAVDEAARRKALRSARSHARRVQSHSASWRRHAATFGGCSKARGRLRAIAGGSYIAFYVPQTE